MMQDVYYLAISCLAKANMARSCKIFPRIFTRDVMMQEGGPYAAVSAEVGVVPVA